MPAQSQTFYFKQSTDGNHHPIEQSSVTYPAGVTGPQTYYSNNAQGDGYFNGRGLHTVTIIPVPEQIAAHPTIVNNFRGTVVIQATLATDPQDSDWFDIADTYTEYTNTFHKPVFYNFYGNFVWIRAKVVINSGVLQSILYNH